MSYTVKITGKDRLTHDVIRFRMERPEGYTFNAGQAIELEVGERPGQAAPFTFTGLNSDPYLELMIKIYSDRNGMTLAISKKEIGDHFIIGDPWDSFINKGPGVFIAGGAGITPFVALLRQLKTDNAIGNSQLFFANKTPHDVFLETEFRQMLGSAYVNVIARQDGSNGTTKENLIDRDFLKNNISGYGRPFYVCGPPGFVEAMQQHLASLGVTEDLVDISL